MGDSALDHKEDGQTRPEDPAGVGGSQRQTGETAAQEGKLQPVAVMVPPRSGR